MENIGINGFDASVLVVISLSASIGMMRGAVREVLAIAAWIGAVLATWYGFEHVRGYAREYIEWRMAADVGAAAAIFIAALALLSIVTHTLSPAVKDSAFGALDRSLGFLFGAARGALVAILLFMGWTAIRGESPHPDWMREARSLPYLSQGADWIGKTYDEAIDAEDVGAIESLRKSAGKAVDVVDALRRVAKSSTKDGAEPQ